MSEKWTGKGSWHRKHDKETYNKNFDGIQWGTINKDKNNDKKTSNGSDSKNGKGS